MSAVSTGMVILVPPGADERWADRHGVVKLHPLPTREESPMEKLIENG